MKIAVIAGGPSFHKKRRKHFPVRWFDCVIGVNDAAMHVQCHYAVTMDRLWLENRLEDVGPRSNIWYRKCIARNVKPTPKHTAFANNNAPGPMSDDQFTLHGDNSAACALNLAYLIGDRNQVYLFGFDMQKGPAGEAHWWPDYPWNIPGPKPATMERWAGNFAAAAEQFRSRGIEVFNVNDRTLIKDFPVISYEEFDKKVHG